MMIIGEMRVKKIKDIDTKMNQNNGSVPNIKTRTVILVRNDMRCKKEKE